MNGHCLRLFQENRRQPVENDEEWHSGGGCVETPALTRRVSAIFGRHHSQPTITHSYGIANIEYTPNASSETLDTTNYQSHVYWVNIIF